MIVDIIATMLVGTSHKALIIGPLLTLAKSLSKQFWLPIELSLQIDLFNLPNDQTMIWLIDYWSVYVSKDF